MVSESCFSDRSVIIILIQESELFCTIYCLIVASSWYCSDSIFLFFTNFIGWIDFQIWQWNFETIGIVLMIQMENIVITLPLHDSWSILRSIKYIKCMSIRRWLFTKDPMFSLDLSINFSSSGDNDELSITNKLLNISSSHKSILLNKFWWIDVIPFVSVNLITICHNEVEIIVESDSVNFKSVHVHFYFKEVSGINSLIWR